MIRFVVVGVLLVSLTGSGAGLLAARAQAQDEEEDVAGASLRGCQGSALSVDNGGEEKDAVSAPGARGSSSGNPFHVVSDGEVRWAGSTDGVIKNFGWDVKLMGVPVKSGSADNDDEETTDEGVEDVNEYLPFKITGLYHVDFSLKGEGGECVGDLWVKLDGNPLGTVPWLAGVGLVILGGVGAWWARPGTAPGAPATGGQQ